jgi:hypothetical protein
MPGIKPGMTEERGRSQTRNVMAGLVPAIHVFDAAIQRCRYSAATRSAV